MSASPPPQPPRAALWRVLFPVVAVGGATPLFFARHLPFADLPEHVAVIATLRHYWDPAFRSQELFTLDGAFRTQYWLYHLVGAVLAVPLGGAERANVALLAMAAVGLPYALRALLRAARHDERLALLGVPLFYNRALAEGLMNFVASIPVCVWGLALALDQAAAPTRKRAVGLAFVGLALFYLHLSSFALFVLGAVAFAMAYEGRRWLSFRGLPATALRVAKRCVWLAPSTLASIVFVLTSPVTHPDASQGVHASIVRFFPKGMLLRVLPSWMHDVWTSRVDDVAAGVAWAGILLTFVPLLPLFPLFPKRTAASPTALADDVLRLRLARALVVLAAAFYFFFPSQVGFAFILDLRMAPFVGLFAVALARRRTGLRAEIPAALVLAGAVVSTVHCAWQMRAFETEEAAYVDVLLRKLPSGKRLLMLAFDPHSPRTQIPPFLHVGAYYRARYGGIASFSFSELPHWPVRYRPEQAPPKKKIVFWDYAPCLYRNTTDGPAYDYVLTRGERRPFDRDAPGPTWRVIGAAREWRLYQRVIGQDVPAPPHFVDRGPCTEATPPPAPPAE